MEMVHTIQLPVKNNMSEWAVQENEIRPHEGDESRMDENDELDPVDLKSANTDHLTQPKSPTINSHCLQIYVESNPGGRLGHRPGMRSPCGRDALCAIGSLGRDEEVTGHRPGIAGAGAARRARRGGGSDGRGTAANGRDDHVALCVGRGDDLTEGVG